ncbi:DUF3515 domain-containing protein [Modestobacter altitudinis]|uniref:DUF3515 domain-containing protein n=1 Tax=Modestobacter altitudinis TaxID=2213158 RepID=UPI001FECF954|nr:DUF3515 domain-containing protein [Modestobacter altitudinis]
MTLAVLVAVVAVLLVLVNVQRDDEPADAGTAVADVSGTTSAPRGDLPPVQVDTPDATSAAELACPVLMGQLPLELAGETSRLVDSDTPYAYAWGDPAIVLVCGVAPPAGYVVGTSTIVISGVEWFVDDTDPDVVVWTTVDRNVPVQVSVPTSTDSATVTALCPIIATALPYVTPAPGG